MNLTRVLQPYVCCMGNPVAGNPTQFVMYRAARACGVDWRFFTSQVDASQFETAFRGVQALGLNGAALFEPFQAAIIPLLDSVTESAICLGKVNVARLDGNSWLGENTLGTAISQCVEKSMVDRDDTESVLLVLGDEALAKVLRLAKPEWSDRVQHIRQVSVSATGTDEKDEAACVSLEEWANGPAKRPVGALVLSTAESGAMLRQLTSLEMSKSACCLVIESGTEKQLRPLRLALQTHHISLVEQVDLMANQAAADFFFWTGVTPAIDLLRDSLEEYMQW